MTPAVAHLAAQVVLHDQLRERGRHRGRRIQVRVERVRGHDAVHARLHRGHERRQVERVHVAPVGVDHGQAQVRVHRGVPLAGEVLGAGRDAGRLHAADARGAQAGDQRGILAVGADADVRAVALGEHVEARAEVDVHAEPSQLAPLDEPLARHHRLVARGTRGEVVREDGDAAVEHDDAAALVIRGDQEPAPEPLLEPRDEAQEALGRLEVTPVEHQPARVDVAQEAQVVVGGVGAGQPDDELPAHHRFEAHAGHLYRR